MWEPSLTSSLRIVGCSKPANSSLRIAVYSLNSPPETVIRKKFSKFHRYLTNNAQKSRKIHRYLNHGEANVGSSEKDGTWFFLWQTSKKRLFWSNSLVGLESANYSQGLSRERELLNPPLEKKLIFLRPCKIHRAKNRRKNPQRNQCGNLHWPRPWE